MSCWYPLWETIFAPTCERRPFGDYVSLLWMIPRYWLADAWWHLWHWWLVWKHRDKRGDSFYRWYVMPGRGRHSDVDPIICPVCFWAGPIRWLVHGYGPCGEDDVEPVDECPRCGTEL